MANEPPVPEASEAIPSPAEPTFGPADPHFNPEFDSDYDPPAPKPAGRPSPPAAAKPEPKAEDKPAEKPAAKNPEPGSGFSRHDPYVVRQAKRFGATQEWIDAQDPDWLEAEVHRAIAEERGPRPEPKKDEPRDDLIEFEFGGKKQSIKADDLDPSVAALFRSLQAQIAEAKSELKGHREAADRRHQADLRQAAEESFAALGESFIAAGAEAHARRVAMLRAAGVTGEDTPAQVRAKLKETAAMLGLAGTAAAPKAEPPAKAEKPAPARDAETGQFVRSADAEAEVEEWRSGGLPRPTDRQPPPPPRLSARETGIKNLAAAMRQNGITPYGA